MKINFIHFFGTGVRLRGQNYRRSLAVFLLVVFLFENAYPLYAFRSFSSLAASNNQPITSVTEEMVDLYSGNFSYSIPLLTVPGPNGENAPIIASYNAGIRVNQKASMIGLGWSIDPGEISRSVVGYPDDYKAMPVYSSAGKFGMANMPAAQFKKTFAFGTFYFGAYNTTDLYLNQYKLTDADSVGFSDSYSQSPHPLINGGLEKSLDIFSNETYHTPANIKKYAAGGSYYGVGNSYVPSDFFQEHTAVYSVPAYDNYYVSGPGLGGKIKPYILKPGLLLTNKRAKSYQHPDLPTGKVQFHFENSTNKTTSIPDAPDNRIKSGYFIRYYTNGEINDPANLFNSSTGVGFLDYENTSASFRRPKNLHPEDGIGAIEITDPSGITYHYSLPVYSFDNIQTQFTNESFPSELRLKPTLHTLSSGLKLCTGIGAEMDIRKEKYAVSWKLTAITGPDYADANNNKTVDLGDQGYWIQYNYKNYTTEFCESDNYFNYGEVYSPKIHPLYTCRSCNYSGYKNPAYKKTFSTFRYSTQIFHLDFIRTATHSAYFVKSVRNDNISFDRVLHRTDNGFNPGLDKSKADLKLDRIILLRNKDGALIENVSNTTYPHTFNSNFRNETSGIDNLVTASKYQANKHLIDQKSLRSVVFKTDYSLCRNYFSNINNSFTYLSLTLGEYFGAYKTGKQGSYEYFNGRSRHFLSLYDHQSGRCTSTNYATGSGKLTLNEIEILEDGAQKVFPSYFLNYNASNPTDNPDYHPGKQDLWGYYKSDHSGPNGCNYPTPASAQNTDAWSLREISLPSKSKIKIEYESDEYQREGFADEPFFDHWLVHAGGAPNDPCLIFPLEETNLAFSGQNNNLATTGGLSFIFLMNDIGSVIGSNSTGTNHKTSRITIPMMSVCVPLQNNPNGNNYTFFSGYNAFMTSVGSGSVSNSTQINSEYTYDSPGNGAGFMPNTGTYYNGGIVYNYGWEEPSFVMCDPQHLSARTYDKSYGYGFSISKFKKLYGGGIRVKEITISDDSQNQSYKRTYTYNDGYCPLVPRPFCAGPQWTFSHSTMYMNYNMYWPYYSSMRNVGYSSVTVKDLDLFGNPNGSITYYFNNSVITNPINPLLVVNASKSNYCSSTGQVSPLHTQSISYSYNTNILCSNQNLLFLGTLNRKIINDNHNTALARVDYNYSAERCIRESYKLPDFSKSKQIPFKTVVIMSGQTYTSWPSVDCHHYENYYYAAEMRDYSLVLLSKTTTSEGISTTENYSYSDHTKSVYQTSTTNNNEVFTTQRSYAYQNLSIYPGTSPGALTSGASMGFKADNVLNANLVAVPCREMTIKKLGNLSFLLSETNHFTNENPYVRKLAPGANIVSGGYVMGRVQVNSYVKLPNGASYLRMLDDATLSSSSTIYSDFVLNSLVTLYDTKYKALETVDNGGRFSSAKYCHNSEFILTKADNVRNGEFTYCTFEDVETVGQNVNGLPIKLFDGALNASCLKSGPVYVNTLISPHTGDCMVSVPPNSYADINKTPSYVTNEFTPGRTYCAKVWVHKSSPSTSYLFAKLIGGTSAIFTTSKYNPANVLVGDWMLMNLEFKIPETANPSNTYLQVGLMNPGNNTANAYFDDFTFHPVDVIVFGNVYDTRTGKLKVCMDNENYATFFNYDAAGRTTTVYKESKTFGKVLVSSEDFGTCEINSTTSPFQSN